jgi:hypothetical protein
MKRAFDKARSFKDRSPGPTLEECEADAIDDGTLRGYQHDESEIQVFESLSYSDERQQWLARFRVLAHPDRPSIELTHSEVLSAGRVFLALDTKPSQCLKATAAFSARLDRATQKLTLG